MGANDHRGIARRSKRLGGPIALRETNYKNSNSEVCSKLISVANTVGMTDEAARVFWDISANNSLALSYHAGEGRSPGAVFISGLAGLWRWLCTSLGIGGLVLVSRIHGCSVVIMKKNFKERTVNLQIIPGVVVDETKLAETVHEEANSRARRPYHFRQSLLA